MKKEFFTKPEMLKENWPGEMNAFSWQDFVTGIPSPLFVVTGYKANGRENASLQSWATFFGESGEFISIIGSVSKDGHLYQSLKETGCCVLNFPASDIYEKCYKTIEHNGFEEDEITASGLTFEEGQRVKAPRIKECFLNIECEFLWEHEHFKESSHVAVALKAVHICMDSDRYDESKLGRYSKDGYLYNINSPRDADTGEDLGEHTGIIQVLF